MVVGNVRTPLSVLLGAVFLVLLIACANVANLLLASGMARRRELAIRLALGAGQRDLARQLILESVVLATAGGVLGILLAERILRTFVTLAGTQLPRAATIAIDGDVLAFTAAVTVAVGVFCGIWPLVLLRTRQLASAVREGDLVTASGGKGFGNGLVFAEIGLAFALLVGAGLLVKNLVLLRSRDAGIRTDRIVAFDIAPSGPRIQVTGADRRLSPRALRSAGTDWRCRECRHDQRAADVPSSDRTARCDRGRQPVAANQAPLVEYLWIYGDYLKTMGIPLSNT